MKNRLALNAVMVLLAVLSFAFCRASAAADGPGENVMYLFAHQDDEVPIIAKMAVDSRAGRDVFAVWITDGSGTADPKLRETESRDTMKYIGVPQENLHFLGFTDRYSWKNLDEVYSKVMKLVEEIKPVEIIADAYEGGNIDHDVSNLMCFLAKEKFDFVKAAYEFPLYNSYKNNYRVNQFLPREDSPTLYTKLDNELLSLKMKVLDFYPTQAAITATLKTLIKKDKLKKYGEPYRAMPNYDYTKRPVDETLGYEANKRNPTSFSDWYGAVTAFLEKLRGGTLDNQGTK